jgi:hypothetical protein
MQIPAQRVPILGQPPKVGFYMAGMCPKCESPVFYHGEFLDTPANAYRTCQCDLHDRQLTFSIPDVYNPQLERMATDGLFLAVQSFLTSYTELKQTQLAMMQEMREQDERYAQALEALGDSDG